MGQVLLIPRTTIPSMTWVISYYTYSKKKQWSEFPKNDERRDVLRMHRGEGPAYQGHQQADLIPAGYSKSCPQRMAKLVQIIPI
jgi:hypothetical protein